MPLWKTMQIRFTLALPLLLFLIGTVVSAVAAYFSYQSIEQDALEEFDRLSVRAEAEILQRVEKVVFALRGASGLYSVSPRVRREQFRHYVQSRDMDKEFPGVRGFGFIERVERGDLDKFIDDQRADDASKFTVRQLINKGLDELYVIKFIEPADNNKGALGLDVASEATRLAGIEQSINTGVATVTGAITLVQDNKQSPGVLLYQSVYQQGVLTSTSQQRRAALVGVLYAPIVMAEIFIAMPAVESGRIDIEIIDTPLNTPGGIMLFDADGHRGKPTTDVGSDPRFTLRKSLRFPGRDVTLSVNSTAMFDASIDQHSSWLTLVAGTLVSGLLGMLLQQQSSARKQAEAQLGAMTVDMRRLASVVENTSSAVSIADQEGVITWVNKGFTLITGYSSDEAIGRTPAELVGSGLADKATLKILEDAAKSSQMCRVEIQNRAKDGRLYWTDTEIQPEFDQQGNRCGFMEIGIDITARKNTELALTEATQAAEAASLSKSQFLASMSHEIRTPMNGVIGMLHLLGKEQLNSKQQHYTQTAKSSADSLLALINDILDVSKIEAGKLDIEVIDFDLHGLFKDLSRTMVQRIDDKNLEFILDIDGIKNQMVLGDPGRLRQILINLLGNAIKFTQQGEILVRASLIDIEGDKDNQLLRCDIIDTGVGIARDKVAQLFDVFTQADSSTTREYGGSGLGLSIVRQLCQLMGGDVKVSSEQGKGSQFSFSLKLGRSEVVLQAIPSIDMAGISMLIVDDNSTNLEVLSGLLEQKSIRINACSSGLECLDLLERQTLEAGQCPFQIAILDMQMPHMDGVELARLIRINPHYNDMSLVMMTSMGARGDAHNYADIGFAAYFHKPTLAQDLYDALALILDSSETQLATGPLLTRHNISNVRESSDAETTKNQLALCVNKRLLLVEDNSINQLVALGMLEDLGLSADVAANGLEAINTLQQAGETPYELILMDCQMPVMDGYAATSNIRGGDAGDRYRNITIVAMTANAMQGDREKCIGAGMNDYLSKPIDEQPLADCLVKWLCASNPSADTNSLVNTGNAHTVETAPLVWDQSALLSRLRNREDRVAKVIQLFLQDMPALVSEFGLFINNNDTAAAINAAHTIKGVAANISGLELQALCADMEAMAKKGHSDELLDAWPEFNRGYQKLYQQLEAAS